MRAGFATGGGSQAGLTEDQYAVEATWRLTQGKAASVSIDKKLPYLEEYSLAFATGENAKAYGRASFAHGIGTEAWGYASEAGGKNCKANNWYGSAGGYSSIVDGQASFAYGYGLNVSKSYAAAFGKYNEGSYTFEVGNGESDAKRKTVFAVNGNGDLLFYNYHDNKLYSLSDIIKGLNGFTAAAVAKDYSN